MRSAFPFVVSVALACPVVRADDGLIAAAKARTERFPAVDITYSMAETIRKGTRPSEIPGKDTFPPRDEACRSENRLVFSKQCARLEFNHPLWDMTHNKLSSKSSVSATNGQSSRMFHPNGIGEGETPKGYIEPSGKMADCASIILIPLTLYFRGADPAVCPLKLEEFRKTGATIPSPKGPLTVYESPLGSSSMELWCDDRTGLAHRFRITTKGKVTEQVDIVYGERPPLGTVPVKWVTDRYERDGSGVLKDTTASETLAIESAAEFDPSLFVITFPPGTEVFDNRTNKYLLVSESGQLIPADAPASSGWGKWWVWCLVAVLAIIGAVVYRRGIPGRRASATRRGLSLVEVLLVIGIGATLAGLVLAGVQAIRERAARLACGNQLRQLATAAHQFASSSDSRLPEGCGYPPGFDPDAYPQPLPVSWHTRLLPYLEREELAKQAADAHALGLSPQSWPAHRSVASQSVKAFLCPTEHRLRNDDGTIALASYRGVAGINVRLLDGMFHPNFVVHLTDVPDGLSSTLLIGERPSGPGGLFGGWYSGHDYSICTWAQLQPAGYTAREARIHPCPNKASPSFQPGTITDPCAADWFWSEHPRGANFAFADGSVRFLTYGSAAMLPLLATRQGGETIPPGDE